MTASQEPKLNADVAIRFGVVRLLVHAQTIHLHEGELKGGSGGMLLPKLFEF